MSEPGFRRVLERQKALVIGVANDESIAYGCAKAFRAVGAELAVSWRNERDRTHVEPLARESKRRLRARWTSPVARFDQHGALPEEPRFRLCLAPRLWALRPGRWGTFRAGFERAGKAAEPLRATDGFGSAHAFAALSSSASSTGARVIENRGPEPGAIDSVDSGPGNPWTPTTPSHWTSSICQY